MLTLSIQTIVCSCLLALPPFQGQTSPSTRQGAASSLPFGLFTSAPGVPPQTLVKAPRNQTSPPPAWSPLAFPTGPNYSMTAMFGPALTAVIQIGGHSTGNDTIPPLDANGVPDIRGRRTWMGVTVSVTNGSLGLSGSLISQRVNRQSGRESPGADLISYYYDQSVGLDPALVDATVLEQSSEQIGFSNTASDDIDGFDFGLGMISHARTSSTMLFTNDREYYFTLKRDCLVEVRGFPGFANADETSIYHIYWNSSDGTWSGPSVYQSGSDLGLTPGLDELDAIAVDPSSRSTIFSTTFDGSGRSQLMVHGYYLVAVSWTPLRTVGGCRRSAGVSPKGGVEVRRAAEMRPFRPL